MHDLRTKEIAVRMKKLREQRGYSFQKLAELTGMTKSTLQRYESGAIHNIPLSRVEDLSDALGIPPWVLMGWETHNKLFRKERIAMSEREICLELLENVPDFKLGYVVAYLKGITAGEAPNAETIQADDTKS